jgi:hypothetical protein
LQVRLSGFITFDDGGWEEFVEGFEKPHHERAISIQRYLDVHPEVDRYVIFDDCEDLGHFVGRPHFIKTDISVGLTEDHVRRALSVLQGQA